MIEQLDVILALVPSEIPVAAVADNVLADLEHLRGRKPTSDEIRGLMDRLHAVAGELAGHAGAQPPGAKP